MRSKHQKLWLAGAAVLGIAWAIRSSSSRDTAQQNVVKDELAERATVKSDIVPGDSCPALTSWVVSPLRTSVGSWIDVSVAATDADPDDNVSYTWAPAENFEAPTQPKTRYRCASPGEQAILLRVSDNRNPVPCSTWLRVIVACGT